MISLDPATISLLAPPCIGTFIGYFTNKVAISMLFRPLRPWRIFGLRVPMTPGVIPSKRGDLANNIGVMVGRHLLTSQDIGGAISAEPFQEHLTQLVDRSVNELLKRDLGPLPEIVPKRFQAYFQVGVKTMKYRLATMVNAYIGSPAFAQKLSTALDSRLNDLLQIQTEELLDSAKRKMVYFFLHGLGRDALMNSQNEERLARFLASTLQRAADQGRTMADLLPEEAIALIRQLIIGQSTALLPKLAQHLTEPTMRRLVAKGILTGLGRFLKSMGPVGAMVRGFLEPETLEGKVSAYLESREDDLLAWLQQPEMQKRSQQILESSIDSFLHTKLSEVLAKVGEDGVRRFCFSCSQQALALVRSDEVMEPLYQAIVSSMEDLSEKGNAPLRNVVERLLPDDSDVMLRESLKHKILSLSRSQSTDRLVHNVIGSLLDAFLDQPMGRLYDVVPHGVRTGSVPSLVLLINKVLLQEVPGIVDSLNLERIVTDKVNGLDLLELEHLLFSIIKEQLKYINIFGAFLGFLLGFVNVAISRLL